MKGLDGWETHNLSAEEAIYNFDMNLLRKLFAGNKIVSKEDGSIPDVVPAYIKIYPADPAWGSTYITLAWYLYEYYKNEQVLKDHFDSMKNMLSS